jgi:tetratricopeptide (TPR) repeat protein
MNYTPRYGDSLLRLFPIVSILLYISACAVKPASDLDSPEYHHKAGMRHVEMGQYNEALTSFNRATDLDKKFAPAYAGMGIAYANMEDKKKAKKYAGKAQDLAGKDPDVLTLCARVWIDLRHQEKKWYKDAEKLLKKALKRKKNHEGATYYTGELYLYQYEFSQAEDHFRKVVEMKGEYSGKADKMWQMSQKIVRAMPGTLVGKKVALHEKISRADLAVLLAEELKISTLMKRQTTPASGFQTPEEMNISNTNLGGPSDAKGHWAEAWINELSQYGILEGAPGQPFYPDSPVNRAEYCMAVQRLLTIVTGDAGLETRYFGENPSRFQDVPSSHPAYNAMALCAERGIMKADMITGRFEPGKSVSGADALLSIRSFQDALRITF